MTDGMQDWEYLREGGLGSGCWSWRKIGSFDGGRGGAEGDDGGGVGLDGG